MYRQKNCSYRCAAARSKEIAITSYPPKRELEALYAGGKSDRDIAKHYRKSHAWVYKVRRHYGIAGKTGWAKRPIVDRTHRRNWTVKLKGEEACRNCGISGVILHLHHIVPRSLAPSATLDLRNGLPLCLRCHMGWHKRYVTICRDILSAEEWSFVSTLKSASWFDERYPERVIVCE
jgi:5-methylcytosine-specific restriction endonuclease McrA